MPVPLQEVITIILPARPTSNPNGIVINEYHASSSLNYHNIIYIYIYIYIRRESRCICYEINDNIVLNCIFMFNMYVMTLN